MSMSPKPGHLIETMRSLGKRNTLPLVNRIMAVILLVLVMMVSLPLTIRTYDTGGGPWGFGMIGLHVLLPLNAYLLFAIAAIVAGDKTRWHLFIAAHVISLMIGLVTFYVFPILPKMFLLIPALLATIGILNRRHLHAYLCVMIVLAIIANTLLLKWELDFNRTIPLIELLKPVPNEP